MAMNNKQPKGSGYVNLQQYMAANQNNRLGSTLSQGVKGTVDASKNVLNKAQNVFDTKLGAEQGRLQQQGSKANQIFSDASNAPQNVTDDAAKTFNSYLQSSFQGPTRLDNETGVLSKAKEAYGAGQLVGSRGGRQELLRRYVGGPNYNPGKQRFDELLLPGDSGLKDARRAALQTLSGAQRGVQLAEERAGTARSDLARQQGELKSNLSNTLKSSNEKLDEQFKNISSEQENYQKLVESAMKGDLEAVQKLGIDPNDQFYQAALRTGGPFAESLFRNTINFTNPENLTREAVASQEQAAQLAALSKLSGETFDPSKAGTFKGASIDYNSQAARNIAEQFATREIGTMPQRALEINQEISRLNEALKSGPGPFSGTKQAYNKAQERKNQLMRELDSLYSQQGIIRGKYGL